MSKFKKIILNKQIILSLLVAIVVLAGVVNWAGTKPDETRPVTAPVAQEDFQPIELDFFTQTALDRDTQRSKSLEIFEQNNNKEEANKLSKYAQQEANIETLIKTKGYEKVVAYITDNNGTFVIKAQGLIAGDIAQIKDIITSNSSLKASQIRISEHN